MKNTQTISTFDRYRIGAEYLMPIMLTIAISIVAGVVGHVVPAMQHDRLSLSSKPDCSVAIRGTGNDGFVMISNAGSAVPESRRCM